MPGGRCLHGGAEIAYYLREPGAIITSLRSQMNGDLVVADRTAYTFGDVRVDLALMKVSRGPDPVPLEPKAFDVLVYLVDHRDRVVPKDELLEAVWPGTFVTPNVLTRAIAQIRKSLADESHEPRYIETVARRGYRFIAPVAVERNGAATIDQDPSPPVASHSLRPRALVVPLLVLVGLCATVALTVLRQSSPHDLSIRRITETGNVIDAVLSGDGKFVAYVESEEGRQTLYVRQVDERNAHALQSAAAVAYWGLSFSPDAQSIFYVVKSVEQPHGALFRIPSLGGTPHPILVDIESMVTFSPTGRDLAFYRLDLKAGTSALMIAGADGSDPHALVTKHPPDSLAPAFFVAPSWSPDGTRIAAVVRSAATGKARLATYAVPSGDGIEFADTYSFATATCWARDGSGVYFVGVPEDEFSTGNGGQIYFQPFPSGPARRITNDVAEYRNVSVSTNGFLLSVGFDINSRLSTLTLADLSEERIAGGRYDGLRGLAWTPDAHVIYHRVLRSRNTLWRSSPDASGHRQLAIDGDARSPAVDGQMLLFFGVLGGQTGIWHAKLDGSEPHLLAGVGNAGSISVAPDRFVYYSSIAQGIPSTFRVSLDGGLPKLVRSEFTAARISHDGRMLVGISRPTADAPARYSIIDARTGAEIQTLDELRVGSTSTPAWLLDDSAVLYTLSERKNIWRRRLTSTQAEQLTHYSDLITFHFELSPDGQKLLLCRGAMTRDAYLLSGIR
jgi:DNA-binding winged helix-turn-helix (wHTH) protein/Tol biopolymer transport system component